MEPIKHGPSPITKLCCQGCAGLITECVRQPDDGESRHPIYNHWCQSKVTANWISQDQGETSVPTWCQHSAARSIWEYKVAVYYFFPLTTETLQRMSDHGWEFLQVFSVVTDEWHVIYKRLNPSTQNRNIQVEIDQPHI